MVKTALEYDLAASSGIAGHVMMVSKLRSTNTSADILVVPDRVRIPTAEPNGGVLSRKTSCRDRMVLVRKLCQPISTNR